MKTVLYQNRSHALLWHYTRNLDTVKTIVDQQQLKPFGDYSDCVPNFQHWTPFMNSRVNLTDVAPEEGLHAVITGTCLQDIQARYSIEALVPTEHLEKKLPLARGYQIYTDEPVDILVLRWWNMAKVEKKLSNGWNIKRYVQNGMPYAHWEPPQDHSTRPELRPVLYQ